MNDKLMFSLLTDEDVVKRLRDMAKVEEAWQSSKRALLLREAAKRIIDMRSVIEEMERS